MSPLAIKLLVSAAGIALCAGLGYGVVSTYRGALERAQAAEQEVLALKGTVADRDAALAGWVERNKAWEDERRRNTEALEQRERERKALAEQHAKAVKEFNHALSLLEGEDAACAARPVPAAVDRLLGR